VTAERAIVSIAAELCVEEWGKGSDNGWDALQPMRCLGCRLHPVNLTIFVRPPNHNALGLRRRRRHSGVGGGRRIICPLGVGVGAESMSKGQTSDTSSSIDAGRSGPATHMRKLLSACLGNHPPALASTICANTVAPPHHIPVHGRIAADCIHTIACPTLVVEEEIVHRMQRS